jgi:hypothetical protein
MGVNSSCFAITERFTIATWRIGAMTNTLGNMLTARRIR